MTMDELEDAARAALDQTGSLVKVPDPVRIVLILPPRKHFSRRARLVPRGYGRCPMGDVLYEKPDGRVAVVFDAAQILDWCVSQKPQNRLFDL